MHFTRLLNRNTYDNWRAAGSKGLDRSTNEMVKEILQWHEVPPLAPETEKAIKELALGPEG